MLTEYQNTALQFIFNACNSECHNIDFLKRILQLSPKALEGAVAAVPFLSVVDALNAATEIHYKPNDRNEVVFASGDMLNKFVSTPVDVTVADRFYSFSMLDSFLWNSESLFLEFTMSPAFVRLHADMADFIEQTEKNNNGFQ